MRYLCIGLCVIACIFAVVATNEAGLAGVVVVSDQVGSTITGGSCGNSTQSAFQSCGSQVCNCVTNCCADIPIYQSTGCGTWKISCGTATCMVCGTSCWTGSVRNQRTQTQCN
jgi:hypothetical protein